MTNREHRNTAFPMSCYIDSTSPRKVTENQSCTVGSIRVAEGIPNSLF